MLAEGLTEQKSSLDHKCKHKQFFTINQRGLRAVLKINVVRVNKNKSLTKEEGLFNC